MKIKFKFPSQQVLLVEECELEDTITKLLRCKLGMNDLCVCSINPIGIFLEEIYFEGQRKEFPIIDDAELLQKEVGQYRSKNMFKPKKYVKCYKELHLLIPYTGKMLFGSNDEYLEGFCFGEELDFNINEKKKDYPHKYKKLTEFVFKNGYLLFENDHSDAAVFINNVLNNNKQISSKSWSYDEPKAPDEMPLEMRWKIEWWFIECY